MKYYIKIDGDIIQDVITTPATGYAEVTLDDTQLPSGINGGWYRWIGSNYVFDQELYNKIQAGVGGTWPILISQSGVRLGVVSGVPQVLSIDLTGIDLSLYRQLKLFLRGKGRQWSPNGRILIRINNDATTSPNRYVSTTMRYVRGDENNTPSGPIWTGAYSDNRGLLAQMDVGNTSAIRDFALSAEFMTSGSVVVSEGICMMPPWLGAYYGGYDLNAAAFSSINITFSGAYETNFLEFDEIALIGLRRE